MSRIHITRKHDLGFERAGRLAYRWAERAEKEFGMECVYEEDQESDRVVFTRDGVQGDLTVNATEFVLDAKLGVLYAPMKGAIESEIVKKLDELIGKEQGRPAATRPRHAPARKKAKG